MRLAIVGSLLVLGGCTSLANLSGGADDAGTDAAAPDAAPDAGGFCGAHVAATLCDDFDDPKAASFPRWTTVDVTGSGAAAVDDAVALSPPRSLLSQLRSSAAVVVQAARLQAGLPSTAQRTRLSFALQMDAPSIPGSGPNDRLSVAELLCVDPATGKSDGAWLMWSSNGAASSLTLRSDYGNTQTPLAVASTKPWVRMELDASWGNMSHVVVRADGNAIADVMLPRSCPAETMFQATVGLAWYGAIATPFTASYDDVLVEVGPP